MFIIEQGSYGKYIYSIAEQGSYGKYIYSIAEQGSYGNYICSITILGCRKIYLLNPCPGIYGNITAQLQF